MSKGISDFSGNVFSLTFTSLQPDFSQRLPVTCQCTVVDKNGNFHEVTVTAGMVSVN